MQLPAETRRAVLGYIKENGISTKSGIDKVIASIESSDTDVDDALIGPLTDLKDNLHENILLTLSSATEELSEKVKDNKNLLSKLTSGIDIADLDTLLSSDAGKAIGLSASDFITDG
ncbi:MAG: hypothetical protein J6T34_00485, partial [Bacilli bacterium]|nr:hypothetical protein [Bacilli bacterium]